MIKKTLTFCLVVLCSEVALSAQKIHSVIDDIYLIERRVNTQSVAPREIRIGVEMATNAYFKLLYSGSILKAGLFPQGFNSVSIPTETLLKETGTHVFNLELKTKAEIIRKEIELDVQLEIKASSEEAEVKNKIPEHRVSIYIDDKLIASRTKTPENRIKVKVESPPLPHNYDPFKPDQTDNPMANSVSIFQVVGLAYHLIKGLTKKKDEGERIPSIRKTSLISLTFNRTNPQGIKKEVRAEIRLRTR
jgi:hypothetical protein